MKNTNIEKKAASKTDKLPLVVIFGRTNVGKSTLFNCLTEKRQALVSAIEGTTRDSNIGMVEWQKRKFQIIDTGGIIDTKLLGQNVKTKEKNRRTDDVDIRVQQQALDYLNKADVAVLIVDARAGLMPQDKSLALELKKLSATGAKDKIILAINKADSPQLRRETSEFHKLGFAKTLAISALNGSGTGDLLDEIVSQLPARKAGRPKTAEKDKSFQPINIAIIGKPNVGKSSLINAIIGENRMIVSAKAHTTREGQDILFEHKGAQLNLIDTAGVSKKGQKSVKKLQTKNTLEKFSINKSLATIGRSNITLLVIDIKEGLTHQEAKLVEEITRRKTGLIIIANKWDLVEERDTKAYTESIRHKLPFAQWAPILFVSAIQGGSKVERILDLAIATYANYNTEVSENALSKFLLKIIKKHSPQKAKGLKHPHLYSLQQVQAAPPKFKIRIGAKDTIHFSYMRYIENRLREKFGFEGVPLTLFIEKNRLVHGKHDEHIVSQKKAKK